MSDRAFCHRIKHTSEGMPAELSPTRRFPILCINYEPLVWIGTHTLHCKAEGQLPYRGKASGQLQCSHTPSLLRPPATWAESHAKVLSQERFHIPLAWLARNIAWLVKLTRCSVLVDSGTIPVTPYNHTIQPLCPSLKHFYFQFLTLQINQRHQAPSAGHNGNNY